MSIRSRYGFYIKDTKSLYHIGTRSDFDLNRTTFRELSFKYNNSAVSPNKLKSYITHRNPQNLWYIAWSAENGIEHVY